MTPTRGHAAPSHPPRPRAAAALVRLGAVLLLAAGAFVAACGASAGEADGGGRPAARGAAGAGGDAQQPAGGTPRGAEGDDRAARVGPLSGLVVNLDPGHNPSNGAHPREINRIVQAGPIRKACDTTGTATNAGWPESRFSLDLARRTARRLRAQGAMVTMVHDGDKPWGPCITIRAALGNRADVAVSLHADGNRAGGARGFHVIRPGLVRGYTGDILRRSRTLALQLRNSMDESGRLPRSTYAGSDGIDVRNDLGGLLLSNVPKVFIETGNMRNAADARILRSTLGRERIAIAVTTSIVRWHRAELVAAAG